MLTVLLTLTVLSVHHSSITIVCVTSTLRRSHVVVIHHFLSSDIGLAYSCLPIVLRLAKLACTTIVINGVQTLSRAKVVGKIRTQASTNLLLLLITVRWHVHRRLLANLVLPLLLRVVVVLGFSDLAI